MGDLLVADIAHPSRVPECTPLGWDPLKIL